LHQLRSALFPARYDITVAEVIGNGGAAAPCHSGFAWPVTWCLMPLNDR
jgi:hypothetical protein